MRHSLGEPVGPLGVANGPAGHGNLAGTEEVGPDEEGLLLALQPAPHDTPTAAAREKPPTGQFPRQVGAEQTDAEVADHTRPIGVTSRLDLVRGEVNPSGEAKH